MAMIQPDDIYRQGYAAAQAGQWPGDNPYRHRITDTFKRRRWIDGFIAALDKDRHSSTSPPETPHAPR